MTSEEPEQLSRVRLQFEMNRDDNPVLYDDLQRFSKGPKRVNRLRLLAHEGLMALQSSGRPGIGIPAIAGGALTERTPAHHLAQALLTNQAFGLPSLDAERG